MSEDVERAALRDAIADALGPYMDGVNSMTLAAADEVLRLVATRERDQIELAAKVADQWANSASCDQHDSDPCCHVRTGAGIAAKIRTLARAQAGEGKEDCGCTRFTRCERHYDV